MQNIKILGVVFTNGLSVTPHVQHLATSSAQILYALKILCAHGLCRMAIQAVFRYVILSRLLYTSPAWWGFAGAQDRQKVYSFLRRSTKVGFYSSDLASFDILCIQADKNLFNKVLHNPNHVLLRLLPLIAHTSHNNYYLRPHKHYRSLPEQLTHLTDCILIIRMLFYQVYWQYLMPACFIVLQFHSDSCQIHGYAVCCTTSTLFWERGTETARKSIIFLCQKCTKMHYFTRNT